MPIVEQSGMNWATAVEEKDTEIEYNEESGFKKVVEYKSDDGRKYKYTNIFRIEKVKVPKSISNRKSSRKFGLAKDDPAGVNSATTVVSDEVFMQFLTNKEEQDKTEVAAAPLPSIKCRYCKGDHWSAKCPHKDILQDKVNMADAAAAAARSAGDTRAEGLSSGASGAYKPPSARSGATPSAFSGKGGKFDSDDYTIRVTNLPEEATENDLMELFKNFGKVNRIFLAKDKNTQTSRGFAFVNFQNKDDAQKAIWGVNDYGYNHLILKVEWAKKDQ